MGDGKKGKHSHTSRSASVQGMAASVGTRKERRINKQIMGMSAAEDCISLKMYSSRFITVIICHF